MYVNARVRTMDPANPTAEAILTVGEQLVHVGTEAEVRARAAAIPGSAQPVIDLGGDTVLPGLIDAHVHALSTAEALAEIDISHIPSLPEAVEAIRAFAANVAPGAWITGGRWDYTKWGMSQQPTAQVLDAALPHIPVALSSIDFHTLWCNTAALEAAGIDRTTPDPPGGEIARDADGNPTGILREDAAGLIYRVVSRMPLAERIEAMSHAQRQWLSEGLTSIHDIDGQSSRKVWLALREQHEQHIRVVKYLRPREMEWAIEHGWQTGGGDDWFRYGGLKLFSDGALGSKSSHMSSPFPHAPGEEPTCGIQVASEAELIDQVREAYANGIVPIIHAIGDQANHHVLNVFAATEADRIAAQERVGFPLRPRIEHTQFLQPADVARLAELGVVASMQPRHCISDLHLLKALTPDPNLAAYAWTDIEAAGGRLAFGSDAPVEPTNPFAAIYAALTRADINGDPATTFQPERRMGAHRALAAHTSGAAYAAGVEDRVGVLKAGMLADFIAVNYDPLGEPAGDSEAALFEHATRVRDTVVNTTVVGGEVRFSR